MKKHIPKLRNQKLFPAPARSVQYQNRVVHVPAAIACRPAQSCVMQLQRVDLLAVTELEIRNPEIALLRGLRPRPGYSYSKYGADQRCSAHVGVTPHEQHLAAPSLA